MPVTNDLTIEAIYNIAAVENPPLRNVLITQCYYELSASFAKRMGTGANWCTFATWASKQAGQTIRHQDLHRTLENLLKNEPEIEAALLLVATLAKHRGAQQTMLQLRDSVTGTIIALAANNAADAVSRGNKKVFEEIAPAFCRFIASCMDDTLYDQSRIDHFCQQFKTGPLPKGQEYLAKAFTNYYRALLEQDHAKKTQLNLLANLCIGFHEQNRLQPEILAALNAPIDTQQVKTELLKKLFSGANWFTKLQLFFQRIFGTTLLDKHIDALLQLVQHRIRMILTEHLMTLTLPPDNCLRLGHDLSVPYPTGLVEIINTDLLSLLAQIDLTPNSVLQSGTTDWANLQERMHYIADLFRCYHQSAELFDDAFTASQVASMKNGQLPGGKL